MVPCYMIIFQAHPPPPGIVLYLRIMDVSVTSPHPKVLIMCIILHCVMVTVSVSSPPPKVPMMCIILYCVM